MTPRPTLRLEDGDLCWTPDGVRTPERRPFTRGDAKRLAGWSARYRDARRKADVLAVVGREIYDWLDGKERWLARALEDARPTWLVEFAAGVHPGSDEALFLEAPWELLADGRGHLAARPGVVFCPIRRLRRPGTPAAPSEYRLSVAFMAWKTSSAGRTR